jgi:hypothetical protein
VILERIKESRSLLCLIAVPWAAVFVLLVLLQWMKGSSPWSGGAKFLLLFGAAIVIFFYERWFIDVTRAAVASEPGESPYKFSNELVPEPNDADDSEGFKRLTQVVDKLQSRIGEEYSDIHSRIGWLVTGQAFLLTGFVTVVNSERMTAGSKQWLTIGIGLAAAAIAFVLALSIFYGTALVEALKVPRDAAEDLAEQIFNVPKTGVRADSSVHRFGHYATRYIPCLAYVVWVALTVLAIREAFGQTAASGITLMFPPVATTTPPVGPAFPPVGAATSGRGWKVLAASPSFALGASTFDAQVPGCPDPEEARRKAKEWLDEVLNAWQTRESSAKSDVLILVGGADRIRLGDALRQQYDTNIGLARSRAETTKAMLIAATRSKREEDKLTPDRILVLVTGPQYSPKAGKLTVGQKETCQDFSDDRKVQVWLPPGG